MKIEIKYLEKVISANQKDNAYSILYYSCLPLGNISSHDDVDDRFSG